MNKLKSKTKSSSWEWNETDSLSGGPEALIAANKKREITNGERAVTGDQKTASATKNSAARSAKRNRRSNPKIKYWKSSWHGN
jgi:hypothetical protein